MTISEFLVNIGANFLASLMFLFFILWFFRPLIIISKEIALDVDEDGKPCYRIKIINKSFHYAFDVDLKLNSRIVLPSDDGGFDTILQPQTLYRDKFSAFSPYKRNKDVAKTKFADHALQIRTYDDLPGILKISHQSLQLQVTLRHGLTGLSRTFTQNYHHVNNIKKGAFVFGNCMDVK